VTGSLVTTLGRRLVLAGLALTALNVAVISFWYVNWEGLRREKVDEQVAAVASALSSGADGRLKLTLPPRLERLFSDYPEAYALKVGAPDGRVLFERNGGLIPLAPVAPEALASFDGMTTSANTSKGRTLAATRKVVVAGKPYLVSYAAAADPAGLTVGVYLDELLGHVVLPLVPFALLLTLVNLWTARRSLSPLVGAAASARRVGLTKTVEPLPIAGLPLEVRTLVEATNEALERLKEALDHERAFNAEAAHALRTPLAVLSARLAALPGEALAPLRADVAAMTRLANQMLASAQAEALTIGDDQSCDLAVIGRELAAQMAPLAIRQGRRLAFEGDGPVMVRGDADALAHAARNLVENALRHAPMGSEVTIAVDADGTLGVMDHGPGIPDAQKGLALTRFWRASPGDGQGSGLGLPIADRIARAHGGVLRIEDREGGGARVALVTPRSAGNAQSARRRPLTSPEEHQRH
jgi:signal transduction histidine kinase